jgi:hypothetical protein
MIWCVGLLCDVYKVRSSFSHRADSSLTLLDSNSGHMIKFQLFDSATSHQCHFSEISTFVVSVAHYMRAYFNYQALRQGSSFALPQDASLLNVRRSSFWIN